VHLIRNSLSFCNWKERKSVAAELKKIYNAETAEMAAKRLEDFEQGPWGKKITPIAQCWRRVWEQVIPFFAYPNEIRKIIYTTNAIESLHMQLRKVLKTRGHFPSERFIIDREREKVSALRDRDLVEAIFSRPLWVVQSSLSLGQHRPSNCGTA
jgi:transposase-like protein